MTTELDQHFDLLDPKTPAPKMTGAVRRMYDSILRSAPRGHFALPDQPAVIAYAQVMVRLDKAQEEVAALSSEIVATSHGPQVAPAVRLHDMLMRRSSQLRRELRLTHAKRGNPIPATRRGKERAQAEMGAQARVEEVHRDPSLMFGGSRAAAMIVERTNDA